MVKLFVIIVTALSAGIALVYGMSGYGFAPMTTPTMLPAIVSFDERTGVVWMSREDFEAIINVLNERNEQIRALRTSRACI